MKQAGQQDLRREGNHWAQWIQQVLDFSLGYIPQVGGSVGLELATVPSGRCGWAAVKEWACPPGLLGVAR